MKRNLMRCIILIVLALFFIPGSGCSSKKEYRKEIGIIVNVEFLAGDRGCTVIHFKDERMISFNHRYEGVIPKGKKVEIRYLKDYFYAGNPYKYIEEIIVLE